MSFWEVVAVLVVGDLIGTALLLGLLFAGRQAQDATTPPPVSDFAHHLQMREERINRAKFHHIVREAEKL